VYTYSMDHMGFEAKKKFLSEVFNAVSGEPQN